ncbi:protein GL2-INTERACTING REPRESSOR 1-like [Curcuma longa]|uniref:protein GL2-INTERACTING REPRESSOR 1-like n=1 Tax=Curcuma longa TaxID=136217 RepID=UPI003D9FA1D7
MSRNRRGQKLDLKLNLSLAPTAPRGEASRRRGAAAEKEEASSPSSCLSSEAEQGSPGEAASMVVGGCPRCLMYVMLSAADLRCPKCGTAVLFDFCAGAASAKSCNKRRA